MKYVLNFLTIILLIAAGCGSDNNHGINARVLFGNKIKLIDSRGDLRPTVG